MSLKSTQRAAKSARIFFRPKPHEKCEFEIARQSFAFSTSYITRSELIISDANVYSMCAYMLDNVWCMNTVAQ